MNFWNRIWPEIDDEQCQQLGQPTEDGGEGIRRNPQSTVFRIPGQRDEEAENDADRHHGRGQLDRQQSAAGEFVAPAGGAES